MRGRQLMSRSDGTDTIVSCWSHPRYSRNHHCHLKCETVKNIHNLTISINTHRLQMCCTRYGSWLHWRDKWAQRCSPSLDGTWRRTSSFEFQDRCQSTRRQPFLRWMTRRIPPCWERLEHILSDTLMRIHGGSNNFPYFWCPRLALCGQK